MSEPMTSAIAAREDLPLRVRELLAAQLAEFGERAAPFLRDTLVQLQQQVAHFGQNARNNAEQEDALNCLQQVKRLRSDGMQLLLDSLEPRLANIDRAMEASAEMVAVEKPALSLSLVDDNRFEESVLIDDLAARAELRFSRQLFELGYRHGALGARTPIEAAELALGPRALLKAIGRVGHDAGLPREFRMVWFRSCDMPLLTQGEEIFAGLNQQLIAQGILPHLRPYLPHRGNQPRTRGGDTRAQDAAASDETALLALQRLLARRREVLKQEPNSNASAPAAPADTVQAALTVLQQRARTAAQPDAAGVQRTVQHLRQDLLAELRRHSENERGFRLPDAHRDALELIALWFEQLLAETRGGGYAQRLLARLQIPLVRAAFVDASVFSRPHPARHLLNTVIETASLWLDGSEGGIDAALSDRLRQAVDHTLATFDGDAALLEQVAVDLDGHVRAMRRRAETAERRQLEAIQGRARMEHAHAIARAAIDQRASTHKPSLLVRTLLEQAWTDALALTVLRDGECSEAFARRLAVVEQLLREPEARDDEHALLKEIENGLLQVGLHEDEAVQLAHRVLDRPAPQSGDATATQTELLVKLKTRQRLGASSPEENIATTPLSEDEQRTLERLRTLPFNTWFDCVVNEQGQRVQRKLIWHDGARHCLLVNARGAPAAECTLEQLARHMAQGRARLLPRQEESLIDRAWHTVVAGLRQFARADSSAS